MDNVIKELMYEYQQGKWDYEQYFGVVVVHPTDVEELTKILVESIPNCTLNERQNIIRFSYGCKLLITTPAKDVYDLAGYCINTAIISKDAFHKYVYGGMQEPSQKYRNPFINYIPYINSRLRSSGKWHSRLVIA